jgi:hypothetical protein
VIKEKKMISLNSKTLRRTSNGVLYYTSRYIYIILCRRIKTASSADRDDHVYGIYIYILVLFIYYYYAHLTLID